MSLPREKRLVPSGVALTRAAVQIHFVDFQRLVGGESNCSFCENAILVQAGRTWITGIEGRYGKVIYEH
jgi:hypothetical protein